MGEIAQLILNGELDYKTGEYLGPACGYPRTKKIKRYSKFGEYNKYGYNSDNWDRMKTKSKIIVKFLYEMGYESVMDRQIVMNKFMMDVIKVDKLPKNSRAYHIIYDKIEEFGKYVENFKKAGI